MPESPQSPQVNTQLAQILLIVNRLQIKAFNAPNREALGFIIVNDTHQIFKYDRALLWEINEGLPSLVAISGQHMLYKEAEFSQKARRLISHLKNPGEPQLLTEDSFTSEPHLWKEIFPKEGTSIYWQPIKVHDKLRLCLWFEIWQQSAAKERNLKEELNFFSSNLFPAFGSAWAKFDPSHYWKTHFRKKKFWYTVALTLFILLFAIRIPLRVAAPSEIVPEKPFVITAPLDGIVAEVHVKPGQTVKEGDLLFDYDKRVPLEELKSAMKQVDISQAEVDRAATLGLSDPKSLTELEVYKLKFQKDKVALELAQSQVGKLDVKAPEAGIVMVDDPDEWRGKPVKIGEKVLTLSDPAKTKLKIWVPENDNVIIDPKREINVILNVAPERELHAKLDYISFESHIGEGDVPAFLAEANWETPPEDIKLGLKGTAILYGERVSLFYFIIRKPWSAFRHFTGF